MTMSLADQAAIAIRNATLYERMMTLEEQVRQLEKIGTAGQISIGLTHELRNPLTVVKMLLDSAIELTAEDRTVIQSEVNRMGEIVEQYLGFAKPQDGAWGTIALHKVIGRSARLVDLRARRQEVDVKLALDAGAPHIIGNENQLEQVFVNLFLNAMDAMTDGGELRVSTRRGMSHVSVHVRDTGTGIPPKVMGRLFEITGFYNDILNGVYTARNHSCFGQKGNRESPPAEKESKLVFGSSIPLLRLRFPLLRLRFPLRRQYPTPQWQTLPTPQAPPQALIVRVPKFRNLATPQTLLKIPTLKIPTRRR